jgi:amidase
MSIRPPTPAQLTEIGETLGMSLTEGEARAYVEIVSDTLATYYRVVDAMPDNLPLVKYPRTPGYRPNADENPHNGWYIKTTIEGAKQGRLKGKRIVIKDNVCVAGVPMMVGASTLEGYVADVDATIVERLLDAGGTIVGKATCEYFCLSGSSFTSATGPVHNPWKRGYTAGGSSSGSAVLVATGEADMAIGGDQGGSIRIPASCCGVYGLKPTYGLVPYTGVMPIELTIDHIGPMTASVADNALMLEIIAGEDGLDPRQSRVRTSRYTEALGRGVEGLRIGVVGEGFCMANADPQVNERVRSAAAVLGELGADVREISLPLHPAGKAIWTPIGLEGLTDLMMLGNGYGTNHLGPFVTSLLDAHAAWRSRADEFPVTVKACLLAGLYMLERYRGRYYAKAQNLRRRLRAEYDAALARHDLLLMPTIPPKPGKLPEADASCGEMVSHAFSFNANCIPTNLTGHPALSVPCGRYDGLPVGMMLVGRHFDEGTIYRAAHAFEQARDWRTL